jgi:mannose-6-phosphate isomerase-like protein (cupin superfamily)
MKYAVIAAVAVSTIAVAFAQGGGAPPQTAPPATSGQAGAPQTPADPQAGRGGPGAQGGAAQAAPPREPPANTATGVSIGRFIGDASKSIGRLSHDVIFTQSILRAGDPAVPGPDGAVLQYRKEIVLGTMAPGQTSSMTTMAEQQVIYVETGAGRLDDGSAFWDLKPGIMLLVPPNQPHRFMSTGDKPLKMLMLSWALDPGITPHKGLIVRDVNLILYTERNVHWSNFAKYVFDDRDGMHPSDRIYIVDMAPMTIAGPHAHAPNSEEAWIKVSDGDAVMQLGSEIRRWPANAGFLAPPNGQTVHAAINISDSVQSWFYFARLNPNAQPRAAAAPAPAAAAGQPPAAGGGRGGGRGGNPAVAASLVTATIAGRPLPK